MTFAAIAAERNAMRILIRRIGNSRGMIIPNAMLQQLGLEGEADVDIVDGALIVRAPAKPARTGWADASKDIATQGDDALVWPELDNANDQDLTW
jgi:antitoxin MazE